MHRFYQRYVCFFFFFCVCTRALDFDLQISAPIIITTIPGSYIDSIRCFGVVIF